MNKMTKQFNTFVTEIMGKLTFIKNIGWLVLAGATPESPLRGKEMRSLPVLENAWVSVEDDQILAYGTMRDFLIPESRIPARVIDATGKMVMPSFCDAHTHLVYAGSREQEYRMKMEGLSYEEIARRGGGILNSASLLHQTSEEELYRQTFIRVQEIMRQGTCSVEIKSGYGLNTEDEIKMLRVIRRLKDTTPLNIRATFLGAHAIPETYKGRKEEYVDMVISEMLPAVAAEDLAEYIDVFCDEGFFSVEDTERMLMAGIKHGLRPRIHANELAVSGGVQVGVKYDAVSVDHLERIGEEEIRCLQQSETIATLLPGAAFFLGLPDPPARKLMEANVPLVLASDYNPGSSPSGNMKLMMSLASIRWKMLPMETIAASTINGAFALEMDDVTGSITAGKQANLIITKPIPSIDFFNYAFGSDLIDTIMLKGEIL